MLANLDGRDFIAARSTGLYFPDVDHAFLDAAWSHVDELRGAKRALALSALCLAAAWKQPRGVFTVTTPRYDDGRRQLHTPLEDLFREAVGRCNAAVMPGPAPHAAATSSRSTRRAALAYLDPPYAPPRDDTCYVKRYHFLEGLATYWRGQEIMWETQTRKLRKRETPFGSKRTVRVALDRLFDHFSARRHWSSPTAPTPTWTPWSSRRCWPPPRHGRAGSRSRTVRLRHASGRHAAGRDRVRVRRTRRPRLYSGRCRRWSSTA